ncbi:hypothetical protein [Anaerococcus lactolyticus]|uniref:hypothetical protein n=1 Tax=Anaerococcus lactolyticus TaxID=33032 RepID=UPI0023F3604C|nr:hypothetical protein [Anaerococcus lactolyticus]
MENKKIDFEDCYDSFYIDLLLFKRRCKRDYGLRMEFDIDFRDEDGNFIRGVRTRDKNMDDEKNTLSNNLIIDCLELSDINDLITQIEEIKKFEKEYKVDCTLKSIKLNKA